MDVDNIYFSSSYGVYEWTGSVPGRFFQVNPGTCVSFVSRFILDAPGGEMAGLAAGTCHRVIGAGQRI